jgi:hypothetical protein
MATGDVTMTLVYTGTANAAALKTAVDGQNEGTQADGTKTAELIFLPMTAGQVAVWKKARSA